MNLLDINADVGESFGPYTLGMDAELMPLLSSANIACGFHAGDPTVMNRTVALAVRHGVAVGAHPGLPDLQGFGRRFMEISLEEIRDLLVYQIGALGAVAKRHGTRLRHVKPHGALYNMAVKNPDIWEVCANVIAELDRRMVLFALAGAASGRLEEIAARTGIRIARECFSDRNYMPDGSLAPRSRPDAMIHDPERAAAHVLDMAGGRLRCVDGSIRPLSPHTVCVHGDGPAAVETARIIRRRLAHNGVKIAPPDSFLPMPGPDTGPDTESDTVLETGGAVPVFSGPRFRAMGEGALIADLGQDLSPPVNRAVARVFRALSGKRHPAFGDIVPCNASLMLTYDPLLISEDAVKDILRKEICAAASGVRSAAGPAAAGRRVEIPVHYGGKDGPDLDWVAGYLGMRPADLITAHCAREYDVYMVGFMPGFPYLGQLPAHMTVPRKETPRTRVPGGSVGLANRQTGIYPASSPGGWQIIGRTDMLLFDPGSDPPAVLRMGDRVRFVPVRKIGGPPGHEETPR